MRFTFGCIILFFSCQAPQKDLEKNQKSTEEHKHYQVAFLIMDGVYNTELTAPFDIFHHTRFRKNIKPMNVFTVAQSTLPVTTFEGILITPDYSFVTDSIPRIDILVVPSAEHHLDTDLENKPMIDWVRKTASTASWVNSHCDGAFVLAKAGLLDRKHCTTFPSDIDLLQKNFPTLITHKNVLWVQDGKFITSVGGAKSFEASLYLCEKLYGKKIADELANGLVIAWNLQDLKYLSFNDTLNYLQKIN